MHVIALLLFLVMMHPFDSRVNLWHMVPTLTYGLRHARHLRYSDQQLGGQKQLDSSTLNSNSIPTAPFELTFRLGHSGCAGDRHMAVSWGPWYRGAVNGEARIEAGQRRINLVKPVVATITVCSVNMTILNRLRSSVNHFRIASEQCSCIKNTLVPSRL